MSVEEKIDEIEEEIKKTPYNKATQHHIGKLKARLARLKDSRIKAKVKGGGFGIKKIGHATAVLLGFPSVGKSTLLNRLTDARSRTGEYDFTTIEVIPGMLNHEGVEIQILDLPGVVGGASIGKGRGREILSIVRNVDIVLIMVDVHGMERVDDVRRELYEVGVRLDKKVPKVRIQKTQRGGIIVNSRVGLKLDEKTIRGILNSYGIHNAQVTINEEIGEEELIDVVAGNRVYLPSLTIVNKIDLVDEPIKKNDFIMISAKGGMNLGVLKEKILGKLNLIRIYLKPRGGAPDLSEPLVLGRGSSIGDVCDSLHKGFKEKFRYALVYGKSVKYDGQRKGLEHVLKDGDVITIVKRV